MTKIAIDIEQKLYKPPANQQANEIITNFSLTLNPNEFVCLVGPSGCGKTTLLNIISGLDTNFQGAISFDEQSKRHKIGYVFQNPRLLPWRTVRQNIELALPDHIDSASINDFLAAMQLTDAQHVYPERLSLGMSRRVSIIRAFAIEPDILLMDEPFVSLDAPTAKQIRQLLVELWQQRPHTVLFVTHDLREAITLADRLIFLSTSPMTIAADLPVKFSREERDNEQVIEDFRHSLIKHYPVFSTNNRWHC